MLTLTHTTDALLFSKRVAQRSQFKISQSALEELSKLNLLVG